MKTQLLMTSQMYKTFRNENLFLKASNITNRPRTVDRTRQNGPVLCWIMFTLDMWTDICIYGFPVYHVTQAAIHPFLHKNIQKW